MASLVSGVAKKGSQPPKLEDSSAPTSSSKLSVKESVKDIPAAAAGRITKPRPSLRKKAFQKQRQDTFHSLNMDVAGGTTSSKCPDDDEEMLQRTESERGDYLRMPSIDSMRISSDTPPRKPSATVQHSDPTTKGTDATTKKFSLDSSTDSASSSPSTTMGMEKKFGSRGGKKTSTVTAPKRLVLHTIEQPDGGVIGFCTEEEHPPATLPQ